jgi:hypothetical protein
MLRVLGLARALVCTAALRAPKTSDHRHRCGGLAGAGKRESITKWLDGWLSRPQTGPLPPLPRSRSGTQGTGTGHFPRDGSMQ